MQQAGRKCLRYTLIQQMPTRCLVWMIILQSIINLPDLYLVGSPHVFNIYNSIIASIQGSIWVCQLCGAWLNHLLKKSKSENEKLSLLITHYLRKELKININSQFVRPHFISTKSNNEKNKILIYLVV